ncbi:hypothetical protein [Trebonia kvetii]|uniref:hypothetical protein n=1 Tax=Trebonia kvetii TaxID=2480626 RepID=UPI001FE4B70E|nr:hypothetical protein [Trebonia kvetii]
MSSLGFTVPQLPGFVVEATSTPLSSPQSSSLPSGEKLGLSRSGCEVLAAFSLTVQFFVYEPLTWSEKSQSRTVRGLPFV